MTRPEPHLNWTIPAPDKPRAVRYPEGLLRGQDHVFAPPAIPIELERWAPSSLSAERLSYGWPREPARRPLGNPPSAKIVILALLILSGLGAASFAALYASVHSGDGPPETAPTPFASPSPGHLTATDTPSFAPVAKEAPTLVPALTAPPLQTAPVAAKETPTLAPTLPPPLQAAVAKNVASPANTEKPAKRHAHPRPHAVAAPPAPSDDTAWGLNVAGQESSGKEGAVDDSPLPEAVPSASAPKETYPPPL